MTGLVLRATAKKTNKFENKIQKIRQRQHNNENDDNDIDNNNEAPGRLAAAAAGTINKQQLAQRYLNRQ